MKSLLILTALAIAAISYASTKEWKVVSESFNCSEKIKILAKEGESFVYAVKGTEKIKLLSGDGSTYERDNKKSTSYISQTGPTGETITYLQPSVVEANPAKVQVINANKSLASANCPMADK